MLCAMFQLLFICWWRDVVRLQFPSIMRTSTRRYWFNYDQLSHACTASEICVSVQTRSMRFLCFPLEDNEFFLLSCRHCCCCCDGFRRDCRDNISNNRLAYLPSFTPQSTVNRRQQRTCSCGEHNIIIIITHSLSRAIMLVWFGFFMWESSGFVSRAFVWWFRK